MKFYQTDEHLPKLGQYVVCRYYGENWFDSGDLQGCRWIVAKREQCNVVGNDKLPYGWQTFGTLRLFGHEVDLWFELPKIILAL